MKNNITELVFILDRSGSMAGLESDTIGGFNGVITRQRRAEGPCHVTTVLFSDRSVTLHDRLPLDRVPAMTERDYCVGGCTALLDALGETIRHIAGIHRYARSEDVPERTLFVIMTDGMENASTRFDLDTVRRMIEHEQAKYGWEFLFLGANMDAVSAAGRMGISMARSSNYRADSAGTKKAYETVAETVLECRMGMPIRDDWNAALEED